MDIPVVPKLGFRTRNARHVLLSLITLLFLLLIVVSPWTESYDQLGTSDWEEVPATISISEIREYETCGEDGCNSNDYPYIRYSYFVDGESYSNDDIVLFDLDEGDFGFSISLVDQHAKGAEVTAY